MKAWKAILFIVGAAMVVAAIVASIVSFKEELRDMIDYLADLLNLPNRKNSDSDDFVDVI